MNRGFENLVFGKRSELRNFIDANFEVKESGGKEKVDLNLVYGSTTLTVYVKDMEFR